MPVSYFNKKKYKLHATVQKSEINPSAGGPIDNTFGMLLVRIYHKPLTNSKSHLQIAVFQAFYFQMLKQQTQSFPSKNKNKSDDDRNSCR